MNPSLAGTSSKNSSALTTSASERSAPNFIEASMPSSSRTRFHPVSKFAEMDCCSHPAAPPIWNGLSVKSLALLAPRDSLDNLNLPHLFDRTHHDKWDGLVALFVGRFGGAFCGTVWWRVCGTVWWRLLGRFGGVCWDGLVAFAGTVWWRSTSSDLFISCSRP